MEAWQDGRCGICGCRNTGLPHVLDHDHATGLTRGWLCWTDNAREGHPKNKHDPLFVNYRARHPAAILGVHSTWRPWRGYRATPTTTRPQEPRMANTSRAAALGAALRTLRNARGWKIADAAVAAKLAPGTWRRLEDGMTVRERSYLAVDRLLGSTPGTVRRALCDDTVMAELLDQAGLVPALATASPGAPLARQQHRVSDVEAVANLLDRLTRHHMTERMAAAVQALLDVMPDLLAMPAGHGGAK